MPKDTHSKPTYPPVSKRHRIESHQLVLIMVACLPLLGATCSGFDYMFGPPMALDSSDAEQELAITIVQPVATVSAALGATTIIQWADIAETPGTVVRLTAQQQNNVGEDVGDPTHLIGDGTPGSGRDALADGDNDVFIWDITGVRVGNYVITAILEAPGGTMATAVSRDDDRNLVGAITITTALSVPTLTFTAPETTDITVNVGDTFDITWTDSGVANTEAMLTLSLDTDNDHESGNEVILLRDQPLSDNGTDGQFTFKFFDENGDAVPEGTYTVFATLDDGVNLIVTEEATGQLILAP